MTVSKSKQSKRTKNDLTAAGSEQLQQSGVQPSEPNQIRSDDSDSMNAGPAPIAKRKRAKSPAAEQPESPIPIRNAVTLRVLAQRYLEALEDSGAGAGTIASYGMELKLAERELGAETLVADLTEARVASYFSCDAVMNTRRGKAKAPPTYLKTRRVLRQALEWAATQGMVESASCGRADTTSD